MSSLVHLPSDRPNLEYHVFRRYPLHVTSRTNIIPRNDFQNTGIKKIVDKGGDIVVFSKSRRH